MAVRVPNPGVLAPIAQSLDSLGKMFLTGPSQADRDMQAEQMALVQAKTAGALGEEGRSAAKHAANLRLGSMFRDALAKRDAASMQSIGDLAIQSGYSPESLGQLFRVTTANDMGSSDAATARSIVGAGGKLGNDGAVSLGDRDALIEGAQAADKSKALAVQGLANRGAMARLLATPIQTAAGGTTTLAPEHPLFRSTGGTIHGAPTESTVSGDILRRIAAGEQLPVSAVNAVGGGGSPSDLGKLLSERDALAPEDPRRKDYDARIAKLNAGQQGTTVTLPDGTVMSTGGQKPLTEAAGVALGRGAMMEIGNDGLDALAERGFSQPSMLQQGFIDEAMTPVGGVFSSLKNNAMLSMLPDEAKEFVTASRQVLDPYARIATGAAVNDGEWRNFATMLIPGPTDTPEVRARKKMAREASVAAIQQASGLPPQQQWQIVAAAAARAGVTPTRSNLRPAGAPAAPTASAPAAYATPAVGAVMDGYRFKGGNPADSGNWEAVQ